MKDWSGKATNLFTILFLIWFMTIFIQHLFGSILILEVVFFSFICSTHNLKKKKPQQRGEFSHEKPPLQNHDTIVTTFCHNKWTKRQVELTPTVNSTMSVPLRSAAAVSSLAILVIKFLALLADCVCMAAQMARVTRLDSAAGPADGLLIMPRRTLLLVFCRRWEKATSADFGHLSWKMLALFFACYWFSFIELVK